MKTNQTYRMLTLVALVIGILSANPALGQLSSEVKLKNVDLNYTDEKILISYSLSGYPSDNYFVWVEIFNSRDQKLAASSISGDINSVKGAGNKTICWDIKNDGITINENIYAKVYARYIPYLKTSAAISKSTVFPGWGDYQYTKGKPHWVKGIIGYSLISGSALMNYQASKHLDQYRRSGLPSSQDPSYSDAKQFRTYSFVMAASAFAIWVWGYCDIFVKSKKSNVINTQTIITDDRYLLYSGLSPSKMINTRGLPPNLYAELSFTDDNENGLLNAQERAMLNITLTNQGKGDAMQLEVNVTDSIVDPSVSISNAHQKINLIKPGESSRITIPISTDLKLKTATHKLTINVLEHYGYDMDPAYLVLNAIAYQPPQLVFSGYEIIDSGKGTAAITEDGKLQAGEQVLVKLVIQNIGKGVAKSSHYSILTTDSNIFIDSTRGILGNIQPGEVKDILFSLSPNKRVSTKDNLPVFLSLTEEVGHGDMKDFQLPIALNQRPPQANIVYIKPDEDPAKKNIARFEYTSNKFRTNIANIVNIKSDIPTGIRRGGSVGVVFGVSSYKELPPAPYADNDAKIIKDYFEKVLGVEQVISYTNEQVSGFIFDDVFNPENGELQRAINKGETEVFVFYSGHGIPDKTGDNIYLFPSDGKISRLETQGYNIEKLYQNLSKLGAKHVTVILDACFSGASRRTERIQTENLIAQKGVKIRPKNSWLTDPNFSIISSSTAEETSLGFDISETGLFTYFLCAGLQGKADSNNDKSITLGELKKYVIQNVTETSRKISGLQTPIFSGDENIVLTSFK